MALITVAELSDYLGAGAAAYSAAQLAAAVAASDAAVKRYCGLNLEPATYYEWQDGDGSTDLLLAQFPVQVIHHVSIGREVMAWVSYTAPADEYLAHATVQNGVLTLSSDTAEWTFPLAASANMAVLAAAVIAAGAGFSMSVIDEMNPLFLAPQHVGLDTVGVDHGLEGPTSGDSGKWYRSAPSVLKRDSGWPCGTGNIFVHYEAGYDPIPADLSMAALMTASAILSGSQGDYNMESEHIGDYSYTRADSATGVIPAPAAALLEGFRRIL